MPCNPQNPKANDPNYECNPKTNRWVKKKVVAVRLEKTKIKTNTKTAAIPIGNCNPKNPKANDPNYTCNPKTNRWVKVKTAARREKTGCDPRSPHANNPSYGCDQATRQWVPNEELVKRDIIKAHPFLATVPDIQRKTLYQVFQLVEAAAGRQKNKTKQQKTKTKTWDTACKEMEEKCPMETDLSGDNWCSLDPKDVFYFTKDGKRFCYGVEEIFSIIHMGFTARDTSYQVPPLRFQLPRDSYDRTPFSKEFFHAFQKHLKKHPHIPKEPEVCYFLKFYKEFYDSPSIHPFLTETNPNKVQLSNAIDNFLMKHRHIDINMDTSRWFWMAGKEPRNKKTYMMS